MNLAKRILLGVVLTLLIGTAYILDQQQASDHRPPAPPAATVTIPPRVTRVIITRTAHAKTHLITHAVTVPPRTVIVKGGSTSTRVIVHPPAPPPKTVTTTRTTTPKPSPTTSRKQICIVGVCVG